MVHSQLLTGKDTLRSSMEFSRAAGRRTGSHLLSARKGIPTLTNVSSKFNKTIQAVPQGTSLLINIPSSMSRSRPEIQMGPVVSGYSKYYPKTNTVKEQQIKCRITLNLTRSISEAVSTCLGPTALALRETVSNPPIELVRVMGCSRHHRAPCTILTNLAALALAEPSRVWQGQ